MHPSAFLLRKFDPEDILTREFLKMLEDRLGWGAQDVVDLVVLVEFVLAWE